MLGDGDKCTVMKKKFLVPGQPEQPRQDKNLLYRNEKPDKPTKKEPLFYLHSLGPHTPQFQKSAGVTRL